MSNKNFKFVMVKQESSKDNRTMCNVQGCFTIFNSPIEQESHMREVHDPRFETISYSRCFYCRKELKHKTTEEHEEICLIKQKIDKFNSSHSQSSDGDIEYIELQEAKLRKANPKSIRVLFNSRTRTALCIHCNNRVEHAKFMEHFKMCSKPQNGIRLDQCGSRQMILCPKEGCNKIIQSFRLQRHLNVKHDERKVSCQNCKKKMSNTELLIHAESCEAPSDLLKFKCNYSNCNRMFSTLQGRNVHMFTHNKYIH